jgi:hypothetical protein
MRCEGSESDSTERMAGPDGGTGELCKLRGRSGITTADRAWLAERAASGWRNFRREGSNRG